MTKVKIKNFFSFSPFYLSFPFSSSFHFYNPPVYRKKIRNEGSVIGQHSKLLPYDITHGNRSLRSLVSPRGDHRLVQYLKHLRHRHYLYVLFDHRWYQGCLDKRRIPRRTYVRFDIVRHWDRHEFTTERTLRRLGQRYERRSHKY